MKKMFNFTLICAGLALVAVACGGSGSSTSRSGGSHATLLKFETGPHYARTGDTAGIARSIAHLDSLLNDRG